MTVLSIVRGNDMTDNMRLNVILGVLCLVFTIAIVYIISYRNNIESSNIYFKTEDISNKTFSNTEASFTNNGSVFTFTVNGEQIFTNEKFSLNVNTGEIVKDKLYLRSVTKEGIILWYNETEYKLDKK